MIPISWAIFSSAPTVFTNIPPTRFPTTSMFNLMSNSPSTTPMQKTNPPIIQIQSPTIRPTASMAPTNTPSLTPTVQPSINPTLMPSAFPTQNPTAILTTSPTQTGVVITSTNSKTSSSESKLSTSNIAAIAGCVSVVLIMIGICYYATNRKNNKLSPYEEWTSYYSDKRRNTNAGTNPNEYPNTDIHHFYTKQNRLSINPNPIFTPHVSINSQSNRNSNIGTKRNSQTHYAI